MITVFCLMVNCVSSGIMTDRMLLFYFKMNIGYNA
jgi:hypothetical protein